MKTLLDYNVDHAYDYYKGNLEPINVNDEIIGHLDVRSTSALKSINIHYVGELFNLSSHKVSTLPNVGKKTLCLIASFAQYANRMNNNPINKNCETPSTISDSDLKDTVSYLTKELAKVEKERDFLKESLSRLLGL